MFAAAAASSPPAGGAPLAQVAIATGFATIATVVLLWFAYGHRSGKGSSLTRLAKFSARVGQIPGWAALPAAVATGSLLLALFGVTWDVSLHIDNGRDPGPLANPAHYFILAGLYGIFAAGLLAMTLPSDDEPRSATAIDLPFLGRIPVGGALMLLCSSFALTGFPLDDVWHRLFGQDVTLWGPTHIMMISGAVLTIIAIIVLVTEGERAAAQAGRGDSAVRAVLSKASPVLATGGLLIGLSVFQGEFDWGVPQFREVWHPLLLAGSSSLCLVAARLRAGRGAAFGAVAFYLVLTIVTNTIVGKLLGETQPAMPLYVAEALCVEVLGLRRGWSRRPMAFGALAGLLCGTVGFAAEYGWTHATFPLPWHTALLAEGIPTAIVAGVAGGVLGALFAGGLRGQLPAPRAARGLALASGAALLVVGANALWHSEQQNVRATLDLRAAGDGRAYVTARFDPPSAAQDADWVQGLAWQGGGLVSRQMRHQADGSWTTARPLPITGDWKTVVRVHKGRSMISAAVYLRPDDAIPYAGVKARGHSTQTMRYDQKFLQLERKADTPTYLWTPAVAIVLLLLGGFLGLIALGIGRLGRPPRDGGEPRPPGEQVRPARRLVPA